MFLVNRYCIHNIISKFSFIDHCTELLHEIKFDSNIMYNEETTIYDAEQLALNGYDAGFYSTKSFMPQSENRHDWIQYTNYLEVLYIRKNL